MWSEQVWGPNPVSARLMISMYWRSEITPQLLHSPAREPGHASSAMKNAALK